jgi:heat shock protein HslJ
MRENHSMTLLQLGIMIALAAIPSQVQAAQGDGGSLEGTAWNAVELSGTPVPAQSADPDRAPHLVFGTGGRLSGADGCNRLTGPYTVKDNGVTFGQIAGTLMACPNTEEVARRFQAALQGTSHWSLVGGRLELYGATGKPLAIFERRPATSPSGAATLQGTRWQLVKFQGGDDRTLTPDDPAKYTIEFAAGGRLTARIDCNRGRGTWKATGSSQLEFDPLALTRATCPEGSLHDQIARQWTYVRSFVLKDGHLFLSLMADGGIYEFAPLASAR